MTIIDIPFVKLTGIEQEDNTLSLEFKKDVLNHLQTFHAGAQFTLAESASGYCLQQLFPELSSEVILVLRDANIKYKKPATRKLTAHASVSNEMIEKFMDGFKRKNRASIVVDVELVDPDNTISSRSSFTWFVQKIN